MSPRFQRRGMPADTSVSFPDAGLPALLADLYARRGMRADETELSLRQLSPPTLLRGAGEAARLLAEALAGSA